jgi:hypothetical protein
MQNGKSTNPSVELTLPISKSIAFYIVQRNLSDALRKKTTEEKENITLESISEFEEKE